MLLIERRVLISAIVAVGTSVVFHTLSPWPVEDPVLILIATERPTLHAALYWTHEVLLLTTPFLAASMAISFAYIFLVRFQPMKVLPTLPCYPRPETRLDLRLIVGERHHPTRPIPIAMPTWLTIPDRGLFTGIAVIGAVGSGKTSGCLSPFAEQILAFRHDRPDRRIGGLVLEVKGDFCHHVRAILKNYEREPDYVEVGLEGPWCYNPLQNDLDAYALAYGIASLLNNVFGKGKEPFWQQAYTNLIKFIILLHKVVDDYVTLFDVYVCAINPDTLARKIEAGEALFARVVRIQVDDMSYLNHRRLSKFPFEYDTEECCMSAPDSEPLREYLKARKIPFRTKDSDKGGDANLDRDTARQAQFEAVRRWFNDDWRRIEPRLRTAIVEGISVFLSLFDDNPAMKRAFCPPKACYDPTANADGRFGVPLPPFAQLIERGQVCALNFPVAANPGLAKTIGTLMKQDFQRAVLGRIPAMAREPDRIWREVLFLCDEYHAFATVGENDPTGDEKFFSLSRQARCIPIVATQSVSSLRSTLPGESWRTLLQSFRTKIFLALSDDFSARIASDLCGKDEQLKLQYHLAESGQDAGVSMLTGRATAHKSTISTSKSYAVQRDFVFEPKVFSELKNAQAIVLAYDGFNPSPPTYCYLKPYYLDPNISYFDHLARGAL